jgi:hypothetical protein
MDLIVFSLDISNRRKKGTPVGGIVTQGVPPQLVAHMEVDGQSPADAGKFYSYDGWEIGW